MSSTAPKAGILIPDTRLMNGASLHSASSQSGAYVGIGDPNSSNEGSMTSFTDGKPDTVTMYHQKCISSGGTLSGGTWGWNGTTSLTPEADDDLTDDSNLLGCADGRYFSNLDDPTNRYRSSQNSNWTDANGLTGCYSRALNKEFIYYAAGRNSIAVLHRDVRNVNNTWTEAIIDDIEFDYHSSARLCLRVSVLQDGAFRMAVVRGGDVHIYHSDDGLEWQPLCLDVVRRFSVTSGDGQLRGWYLEDDVLPRHEIFNVLMDTSGGYMRMVWYAIITRGSVSASQKDEGGYTYEGQMEPEEDKNVETAYAVLSCVSSDRGTTWRFVDVPDTTSKRKNNTASPLAPTACGSTLKNNAGWQLAGVDDGGGSFVLAVKVSSSEIAVYTSSGMEGFEENDAMRVYLSKHSAIEQESFDNLILGCSVDRLFLVLTGYTHVNLVENAVYYDGAWKILSLDRRRALANQRWSNYGFVPNKQAYKCFLPANPSLYSIGHSAVILSNLYDVRTGGASQSSMYARFDGEWSEYPVKETYLDNYAAAFVPVERYQPTHAMWNRYEWWSVAGMPNYAATGDPSTQIVYTNGQPQYGYATWKRGYTELTSVRRHAQKWSYGDSDTLPTEVSWGLTRTGSNVHYPQGSITEACFMIDNGSSVHHDRYVGFRLRINNSNLSDGAYRAELGVYINSNSIELYDVRKEATLAEFTLDSQKYGSTPFKGHYWVIRFGIEVDPEETYSAWRNRFVCRLRREDREDWEGFDADMSAVRLTYTGSGTHEAGQSIAWGHVTGQTFTQGQGTFKSRWRWCRMHAGGDLSMTRQTGIKEYSDNAPTMKYYYDRLHAMRGAEFTPFGRMMSQGVSAYWGGGGASHGDVFTIPVHYQYAASQLLLPSPSMHYMGAGTSSTEEIVFDAGEGNAFVADGFAAVATNAHRVQVFYSNSTTFSTATLDTELAHYQDYSVTSINGDNITFSTTGSNSPYHPYDAEVFDDAACTRYVRITATSDATNLPVGTVYEITMHRGSQIRLAGGGIPAGVAASGIEFDILSGRVAKSHALTQARYVKVVLHGSSEQSIKCGCLLIGQYLTLDVPMEWEHTTSDAQNISMATASSGIKTAHKNGAPRRAISGDLIGDVDQFRDTLRHIMRYIDFSKHPVVLQLDDEEHLDPDLIYYGRMTSDYTGKHDGWRLVDGRWYRIGDTTIALQEEI